MSKTLQQIYVLNPAASILDTDLFYLVQSPYAPGSDAGISGATLKSLFVLSSATINVAHGGTGNTGFTPYSVICGGTALTSPLQNVSGVGTSGQLLTSNGAGFLPTWQNSATSGTVTSISAGTGITLTPNPVTTTGSVALTVPVTEILGGTNQTTYTLGDMIYASAANTLAKLSGNITSVKQYLSQTGTGAVSAAPAWATISGSDITGAALSKTDDTNVTLTLGGTPLTSLLRATSLTLGWTGQLAVGRGGTGNSTFTAFSVLCAGTTATGAFQNVSGVGSLGNVLTSQGAGTLPIWAAPATSGTVTSITAGTGITLTPSPITTTGSVALTVPVTEILGGTNQTAYTLGDILYSSAANTLSRLAGNTTTAKQYLSQTGTGAVSAAPAWATISGSDITGAALTRTDDTNVTLTLGGTPSTALLRASSLTLGWTGQLSLARGGTNASLTASNGGIFYSTASAGAILSGTATANQILMSGASAAPSWSTATYPATAGTSGNVLTSDGTNFTSSAPASQAGRLIGVQTFTASGTYTPTAGTNGIYAIAVGGGGGGAGTGAGATGGGAGGTTVLGALITANGGAGGPNNAGGSGGVAGTGTIHLPGSAGTNGQGLNANVIDGGSGGAGIFGSGAGLGGSSGGAGSAAGTNTGAGGGGAGGASAVNSGGGGGGGAIEIYFTASGITGTYTVTLNNGGTAGGAGTGGAAGGAGAKGILIIQEYS